MNAIEIQGLSKSFCGMHYVISKIHVGFVCGSLGSVMLPFMMLSMNTPLCATIMNVLLCLTGGA